jgi:hypothetical protein
MAGTRAGWHPIGALAIVVLSVVLPACRSPGGPPPPMVRNPEDGPTTSSRFALRPILDGAGYRPYYLGGYAGASYSSDVTVSEGNWTPQ